MKITARINKTNSFSKMGNLFSTMVTFRNILNRNTNEMHSLSLDLLNNEIKICPIDSESNYFYSFNFPIKRLDYGQEK